MDKNVAIGIQDFGDLIQKNCFYIDKTDFIREWWERNDSVTLITRPRRFGKTLNLSMTEHFFSVKYANQGGIFEGLSIWERKVYRKLHGTYPVISLSFANVKETNYKNTVTRICQLITELYEKNHFLLNSGLLTDSEKQFFHSVGNNMPEVVATIAIYKLSGYLYRYYGKKVIILLDEYDTPMQEAYMNGFWNDLASFIRNMFNAAFKTNTYLERAIMTGITMISQESIFSNLNHLKGVTNTSLEYETSFGLTEEEVFAALDRYGLSDQKEQIKNWYDGFIFGSKTDIYNPWSILNFLDKRKIGLYWANTSSNGLASKLIREGSPSIKMKFEELLHGKHLWMPVDEQIVYNQLTGSEKAVFSLLLASGYLKAVSYEEYGSISFGKVPDYELALTNQEVTLAFQTMISNWFTEADSDYNDFIKALLQGDLKAMNGYMNRVALQTFRYFDTGKKPSSTEPVP